MKNLSNDNIAFDIQTLTAMLEERKYARRDVLRLAIMVEEILLNYQEKSGTDTLYEINFKKRFTVDRISIKVNGPAFDCRITDPDSEEQILHRMLAGGDCCSWYYKKNCNRITILPPARKTIPDIVFIFLALFLSIGAYALCKVLPEGISTLISDMVIPGLSDIMYSILRMIAGLLIFFTIFSSIVHIGSLETLKSTLKRILSKSFLDAAGIIAVGAIILSFFVSSEAASGKFDFSGIVQLLGDMIPRDIFTPFTNGNMMQITIIALVCGILLLIIGRTDDTILSLIETGQSAVVFSMTYFCKFLPFLVFLNVFTVLPSFQSVSLNDIILPVALGIGMVLFIAAVETVKVCLLHKIKFSAYIKAIMPATLITLTTASSSAAIDSIKSDLRSLGVNRDFTDLALPLELVFYKPFSIVIAFTGVLSVSLTMGHPLSVASIISWAILAMIINIACPSVPGGMLSCLTILYTQLQLPEGSMGILILMSTIFDYIGGGLSVYSIQTAITGLAYKSENIKKNMD